MKSPRNESEDLAERLRSLYQIYNCENELPAHNDLVAGLDSVKAEVRDATRIELDRDYIYPLSYKKALEFEKSIPLSQKFIMLYALTLVGGAVYVAEKCKEKNRKEERFFWGLCAFYGGLVCFSSAVRGVFLTSTEEQAKDLMEEHNKHAVRYFELFKRNIEYYVLRQLEINQSLQSLNSKDQVKN